MLNPKSGTYHVRVDYYSDHNNGPTTASLNVYIGGKLKFSEKYTFTSCDYNATDGLGSSSSSFWDAHSFTLDDFKITEILFSTESDIDNARFTTAPDERLITVNVTAPDNVANNNIHYEITETEEGFTINTEDITGRQIQFNASHKPLEGLTNPRYSHRLRYRIVSYILNEKGERIRETEPVIVTQDIKEQIRQEYIDKRDFNSNFVRVTPNYNSIISETNFNQEDSPNFTYEEFVDNSDFVPYTIIGDNQNIAQTMRDAYGFPIRVTSSWRNPRRNDSLIPISSENSFHQTGDAVDLNPMRGGPWPEGITTYQQAIDRLVLTAYNTLNNEIYDVLYHANHFHIERDPN